MTSLRLTLKCKPRGSNCSKAKINIIFGFITSESVFLHYAIFEIPKFRKYDTPYWISLTSLIQVSRQRLGRGRGNDWAGTWTKGLGRDGAEASAWVRTHGRDWTEAWAWARTGTGSRSNRILWQGLRLNLCENKDGAWAWVWVSLGLNWGYAFQQDLYASPFLNLADSHQNKVGTGDVMFEPTDPVLAQNRARQSFCMAWT